VIASNLDAGLANLGIATLAVHDFATNDVGQSCGIAP